MSVMICYPIWHSQLDSNTGIRISVEVHRQVPRPLFHNTRLQMQNWLPSRIGDLVQDELRYRTEEKIV